MGLLYLSSFLSSLPFPSSAPIMSLIGVVLIARHGDREGYYQSPSRSVHPSPHSSPADLLQLPSERHEDHPARIGADV